MTIIEIFMNTKISGQNVHSYQDRSVEFKTLWPIDAI